MNFRNDSLVLILTTLSLLSMVTGLTYGSNNSLTVLWKIRIYSRILLTQLAQDWADTELSNILDYQMVTTLIWVLTHNLLLLLLFLGCTTNCKSIPFGCLLHLLVQGYQGLFLCFCSLHSWSNWWSRRQGVRRFTFDVQRLLVTFLNMSLRSASFMMKSFLVKGKTSGLGNTLLKCRINRLSRFLIYQTSD